MNNRTTRRAAMACGISLLALSISTVLHAQTGSDADAPERTLESVVITGTHIRGAEAAGKAVLVFDSEHITATGRPTVGDFLRELPANFAGGVGMSDNVQGLQDASVGGSNMTGGQGVNLRGLGALSTLVLINGRRVAAAGQYGDFVDVSTIPVNAVDSIEILLDGASAVYGSDAVGGVVNIRLKRRDDGARTSLRYGNTSGADQYQFGQTWGADWGDGGLFFGYEYNRQQNLLADDRDIYNGADHSDRGGINWQRATARAGRAANLFGATAAPNGNVVWRVPGGSGTGLTADDLIAVSDGVGNTHNPWAMVDLLPEMERHSGFFGFEQQVGDGTELYGDLRYSSRRGEYNQGYLALYGTLGPNNPHFIPGVANNYGVLIDDRPLRREVGVDSLAATLGASFALGGSWRGDATLSYSREDQFRDSDVQRNGNIYDYLATPAGGSVQAPTAIQCSQGLAGNASPAAQAYCAGLGYAWFNPWSTDPLSSQVLSQLIGYENLDFASWLLQGSFKVDGELFALPGGTARLATGVDWRRENIGGGLDFNWRSTSPQQSTFGSTERDVGAVFAEMALPLIGADNASRFAKRLDVSLAGRYERGDGLGDFSTFNPRVGIDFQPTDNLTIHGSWGTSFHAPPMRYAYDGVQPISGGNGAFLRADLYTAPCTTTLVPLNGVVGTPGGDGNCSFSAIVITGGAGPTLKPEESTTWTLGFDYAPNWAPGLNIGASYFNMTVDDRIVRIQGGSLGGILAQLFATGTTPYINSLEIRPDAARVQALMDNDPRYLGQLGAGPVQQAGDVVMIVNATQLNLAALKMDGVDLNLSYGFDAGSIGFLELFARGTWLNRYETQATPGSDFVDQLGQYSPVGNPVRLRSQQGLVWQAGDIRSTLTWNHAASYECTGCFVPNAAGMPSLSTTPRKIGAWNTIDINVDYDLYRFGGFFQNARVSFSAVNVTDRDPPFVEGATAANDALVDPYDPANATALGRAFVLAFDKRW